jgi:hypothetical protein
MKRVLAVIAGVITGFVVIFVGDATAHSLHPMPLGLNHMDKNVMLNYIAGIPKYVMVVLVVFWLLSAFLGGLVAGFLFKSQWRSAAATTGAILLAANLLNLIMTAPAHPVWMWICAIAGILPFAFIGGWIVRPKTNQPIS